MGQDPWSEAAGDSDQMRKAADTHLKSPTTCQALVYQPDKAGTAIPLFQMMKPRHRRRRNLLRYRDALLLHPQPLTILT